ncbi:MAG: carbon storage regulator CsrA [Phycisphaerales bacterium]
MLVLSRQRDETIMIGDDIEITVVDIRGDKVRLGINAPSRVAVHRKEVYEAIRRENEQAARSMALDPPDLPALRPAAGAMGGAGASGVMPGGRLAPDRLRTLRASGTPPGLGGGGVLGGPSGAPASGTPPDAMTLNLQARRKPA